jgi:RimJ/RimL family protein N-acetyltransferase
MTEAADAVTAFAFEALGWPHIYVTNAATNLASHRIKEKQGFTLVEVVDGEFVEGPRSKEVWLLTREAWLARMI